MTGSTLLLQLLLDHGADPHATDILGRTALMLPFEIGDQLSGELIQFLIDVGVDVNPGTASWTPLIYAAMQGHVESVTVLLDNGAEINAVGADGITALDIAMQLEFDGSHQDCIDLLLERGAKTGDQVKEDK